MSRRVAVIGLDCAEPSLVFERWRDELPNLRRLIERGAWGRLRSTDPPITVPAWTCMMTGRDPGELGIYGFRNRRDYSYGGLGVADARAIPVERLWDRLGQAGKHVVVLGVPQSYPPLPVNGELVSCFLTPDTRTSEFTYPAELRREIQELIGDYQVDVKNFRSDDRDRILAEIYSMSEQHFRLARHLLDSRLWDFFMMVEIGVDRIHHAFWSFMDPTHPKYQPNHRYRDVICDYYRYIDEEVGELLERFDDDTMVMVVSDHGAKSMAGAVCVNEWLMQEGYLTLKNRPEQPVPFGKADVDWTRTRAWGEGGYYCRLCLNVAGREPAGIVAPETYEALRDELIAKLEAQRGPDGQPLGTRVYRPEDLWRAQHGIPPDLIVYFGDLAWRSNGTLGHGQIFSFDNDTGPDDANHARDGLYIAAGPGVVPGERHGMSLFDVAPAILDAFGLTVAAEASAAASGRD